MLESSEVRVIPAYLEGALFERAEKLAKRCKRMGVVAPVVTVTERFVKTDDETKKPVAYLRYVVVGESPKLEGDWKVVASVQHLEAGNVVSVAPAFRENPPVGLFDAQPSCDHCGTTRNRKVTVIVEDRDGNRARVGTDCIKDFCGHALPAVWETFDDGYALDPESIGYGSRPSLDLTDLVASTFAVIREYGWVKSRDDYGRTATFEIASEVARGSHRGCSFGSCRVCAYPVSEQDSALAISAVEWVASLSETEGYLANLRVACLSEITPKTVALVASLARAYDNHLQGEARRKAREAERESEVVSDCLTGRVEVAGVVTSTDSRANDFGVRYVMTVKDDRGFRVWGTIPSAINPSVGDRVAFTATVEKSDKDSTFGFYTRPSKARMLETA